MGMACREAVKNSPGFRQKRYPVIVLKHKLFFLNFKTFKIIKP